MRSSLSQCLWIRHSFYLSAITYRSLSNFCLCRIPHHLYRTQQKKSPRLEKAEVILYPICTVDSAADILRHHRISFTCVPEYHVILIRFTFKVDDSGHTNIGSFLGWEAEPPFLFRKFYTVHVLPKMLLHYVLEWKYCIHLSIPKKTGAIPQSVTFISSSEGRCHFWT